MWLVLIATLILFPFNSCFHISNLCQNKCLNNGTCIINSEDKRESCLCSKAFSGDRCQVNIDECSSSPCRHGGLCIDGLGEFICSCPEGYEGRFCEIPIDPCYHNPCENQGACIRTGYHNDKFRCVCPINYSGRLCQIYIKDYCASSPCLSNATCENSPHGYRCYCPSDDQCDKAKIKNLTCSTLFNNTNQCVYGICQHGKCSCFPGWKGDFCSDDIDECKMNPCVNQGTCYNTPGSYLCLCPPGMTNKNCHNIQCSESTCLNGGVCSRKDNGISFCQCPANFYGHHCELLVVNTRHSQATMDTCQINNCSSKRNNNRCDHECNFAPCQFDNYECTLKRDPWDLCPINDCWRLFRNGQCDEKCNIKECLLDGFDCDRQLSTCNISYCQSVVLNGICNHECNKIGCDYDRDDCVPTYNDGLLGTIVLQLEITKETFDKRKESFLQRFSSILNSPVKISLNKDGSELILPWYKDGNDKTKPIGIKIYITILKTCNSSNSSNCQFDSVRQSVDYLGALQQNGELAERLQMPISDINILPDSAQPVKDKSKYIYLVTIIPCVLVLTLLVGYGLMQRPRRLIKAPVWFPTTLIDENKRETSWINRIKTKNTNFDVSNNKKQKLDHQSLSPDCETMPTNTLNIPGGPNGDINILELEISRRDPFGKYEADEETNLNFYINNGADIHSRSGSNQETLLHLACRRRRLTAVRVLIAHGSDPNARDIYGATPLLRAVSAKALDIVQFLLTNANMLKLDINASTYTYERDNEELPGDNPLRKAIRAHYNDIAECLLIAGADVDATDRCDASVGGNETRIGRTALHYSAITNNMNGALLLLKHTANIEAQDEHLETPLYKAAYNLAFATWEVLIRHGAKSQIANEDGYTPKSIAMKQIGAGPFRFGPDSDEVLNSIQPKSDAEKHFIQWLKNECPPNCHLESTNIKKEPIRKKTIVKKKTNYMHHYPQTAQLLNNNSHSQPPPPPPYTMTNCYQQPFYGQYPLPTPYTHVEHFQPSPPPSSQCEIADQELYFPISYPSFSL
ncbi:unnamed protein product [Rotaria magnacalcarata]|uniref:Notch n=1 Tax=Rotaria magnacalcarata TaxID=392030 RepID=A0A818ZFE1_9BILA|nr:unnamed protein product [Rotaria magnacalcarata]CAF3764176.1 unnamed protein product [Rotaria magnacalcarata]